MFKLKSIYDFTVLLLSPFKEHGLKGELFVSLLLPEYFTGNCHSSDFDGSQSVDDPRIAVNINRQTKPSSSSSTAASSRVNSGRRLATGDRRPAGTQTQIQFPIPPWRLPCQGTHDAVKINTQQTALAVAVATLTIWMVRCKWAAINAKSRKFKLITFFN